MTAKIVRSRGRKGIAVIVGKRRLYIPDADVMAVARALVMEAMRQGVISFSSSRPLAEQLRMHDAGPAAGRTIAHE